MLRSIVSASLLLASVAAIAQTATSPAKAFLYADASRGISIPTDGWRIDGEYYFREKDGRDCARVHRGDTPIDGRTITYVSTYRFAGARDEVHVKQFFDTYAALEFAIDECR